MSDQKFVVNPWKLAFYLIFLANIVFHSSANFLLLVLLVVIFGYAYLFLSLFFFSFSTGEINAMLNVVNSKYAAINLVSSSLKSLLNKLLNVIGAFTSIFFIWDSRLLHYRCDDFPTNLNFLFVLLENYYLAEGKQLLDSTLSSEELDIRAQVNSLLTS